MNNINIGDVVKRAGEDATTCYGIEVGDVVEKNGERCRVAWRDRQVPNFYDASRGMVTCKGKRTWVRQDRLVRQEVAVAVKDNSYHVMVLQADGTWEDVAQSNSFGDCQNYIRACLKGQTSKVVGPEGEWMSK